MVYKDELRDEIFKEKLGVVSPKDIARTARERGGGTLGVVEVLLTEYNKRMKGNMLSWKKLNNLRDAYFSEESSDAPAE